MKVILEFKHDGEQAIDLLKNSRAWLGEYGLKVEEKLSKNNDSTYWLIDPDINKNIQFLFIVEDDDEIPINMNKPPSTPDEQNNQEEEFKKEIDDKINELEKSEFDNMHTKLNEEIIEQEYDDNVKSILKFISTNMNHLNEGINKILNELDNIKYPDRSNIHENVKNDIINKFNAFKNLLNESDEDEEYDVFLSDPNKTDDDDMSEEELLYRNEIIQRISELNGPDYKLHLIDILLEYIDDQKIDKAAYKKMTEMND